MTLWDNDNGQAWREARDSYEARVAAREVNRLPELDRWYRFQLPRDLQSRQPPFITRDELIAVTEWKMKRGVYRGRNLALVKKNSEPEVKSKSTQAFGVIPDVRKAVSLLSKLSGVGPAASSAILAAHRPDLFPFFDEDVAKQIPELGRVAFTQSYYLRYGEALRSRAQVLTKASASLWNAQDVAQALWARRPADSATNSSS
jgi:hypothetical protein